MRNLGKFVIVAILALVAPILIGGEQLAFAAKGKPHAAKPKKPARAKPAPKPKRAHPPTAHKKPAVQKKAAGKKPGKPKAKAKTPHKKPAFAKPKKPARAKKPTPKNKTAHKKPTVTRPNVDHSKPSKPNLAKSAPKITKPIAVAPKSPTPKSGVTINNTKTETTSVVKNTRPTLVRVVPRHHFHPWVGYGPVVGGGTYVGPRETIVYKPQIIAPGGTRPGVAAANAGDKPLARANLVGTWQQKGPDGLPLQLVFRDDGKINDPKGKSTWILNDNVLSLTLISNEGPQTYTCQVGTDQKSYRGKNEQGQEVLGMKIR